MADSEAVISELDRALDLAVDGEIPALMTLPSTRMALAIHAITRRSELLISLDM